MAGSSSMSVSSVLSILKAYWFPLALFTASVFFQLSVLPRSFPPTHYDALGIKRFSSIEEVTEAYERLASNWNSGLEDFGTIDFVKIQYAFELMTNELWKRDYDIFGIDEQLHVFEKVNEQYAGESVSTIELPLLEAVSFDPGHTYDVTKPEDFLAKLEENKALLAQVFSLGSNKCVEFYEKWKIIVMYLEGVANTRMIELSNVDLAVFLAEKKSTGQPFFRNGLPSLVALPPGCKTSHCVVRYTGELSVDAVIDWFATSILNLPRIKYYSKESLAQSFLDKSSSHKVKVIFISRTGERATPILRQAAKNYWAFASFAFVLWQEKESSFWWETFAVESAPAIVFVKDPGVKPVVYPAGSINSSEFLSIMEQNKHQVLPQLRNMTATELGCDARGYSRAGNDTTVWYCVILAGRRSLELDIMRETIRRVQETLSNNGVSNSVDEDLLFSPLATALRERRLTFTWLDGEAQSKFCFFYLNSENSYDTCGPRRDVVDIPRLFIVRYKRNDTEDGTKTEKKQNKILGSLSINDDVDPTSQLVANYNGSSEVSQIIQWILQVIKNGESTDLPSFKTNTPKLVPEDADSFWSRGSERILSSRNQIKQRTQDFISGIYDYLHDPRIGPILLLAALISFGSIWLQRSQVTRPIETNKSSQPVEEDRPNRRRHQRSERNRDHPPSITDMEPKDAYEMQFSDSE